MTEIRRDAFRITHGGHGYIEAAELRLYCRVIDISVTGARLRVSGEPTLPERVTLATEIAGTPIRVGATVVRGNAHKTSRTIAVRFDDGDAAGLGWLINELQRSILAARPRRDAERRGDQQPHLRLID